MKTWNIVDDVTLVSFARGLISGRNFYNLFKNTENGEVKEQFMSISSMETFMEENPIWILNHSDSASIVTGINLKPAQGFRDLLKVMKKRAGDTSQINDW